MSYGNGDSTPELYPESEMRSVRGGRQVDGIMRRKLRATRDSRLILYSGKFYYKIANFFTSPEPGSLRDRRGAAGTPKEGEKAGSVT